MRKLLVLQHLSLDGVVQGPGGRDEDTSGGFSQGGWIGGYSDAILGEGLKEHMNSKFDLLLGRKTYDIWAPYWPLHSDIWPNANAATKYVASNTLSSGAWQPAEILRGDIAGRIEKIKQQQGPDLHVWGSSNLIQTLMQHDLVDALWLIIYPITIGAGKRLWGYASTPTRFALTGTKPTTKGVILASYERVGMSPNRL